MATPPPNPVIASPRVHSLLNSLHALSLEQEGSETLATYWHTKNSQAASSGTTWTADDDSIMRDKFIALEQDKAQFVYLLARSTGAKYIVEAGTSFGVSTIYLALAVGQNVAACKSVGGEGGKVSGKVFATEQEPSKALRAREHWAKAGAEAEEWITLLVGDLRETVPKELEKEDVSVDLVLIDSMSFPVSSFFYVLRASISHSINIRSAS